MNNDQTSFVCMYFIGKNSIFVVFIEMTRMRRRVIEILQKKGRTMGRKKKGMVKTKLLMLTFRRCCILGTCGW